MKLSVGVVPIVVVLGAPCVAPAFGQSLGDLAQKEKEKRQSKNPAPPPKVYGENDLANYSGDRPEGPPGEGEASPAMSATPKEGAAKKPGAAPTPTPEARDDEAERRAAEDRKAEVEGLRARWRDARARVAEAERRLAASEAELKTLPPGLPAGNYYDDIQAAVEQQKVEREQRNILAKKALVAAKEALDAVETEARRRQVRLE